VNARRKPRAAPPARAARPPGVPEEIYFVACGKWTADAGALSPAEMGSKAYNLLRMAGLGLAVPPAFVIGTPYCKRFESDPGELSMTLRPAYPAALAVLENATGRRLGHRYSPLLLSIRSGAPVSMPGMMETLLNVGLCDATLAGLVRLTGNPRLAWDAYRRLIAGFGEVVANVPAEAFEEELRRLAAGQDERQLDFDQLRSLARRYLEVYREAAGEPFPQDPFEQLGRAVEAVFASWQSPKARDYRRLNKIDARIGTAVAVQSMVFGNAGGMSGAGVGFSRDPASGERSLWVDFLFNAQGEDVVSGRRSAPAHGRLAAALPEAWNALEAAAARLEREFGDMQDFEFTVEEGKLYLLQARSGKRTPAAHARITLDLCDEGILTREEAVRRLQSLDAGSLSITRVVSVEGESLAPVARASAASSGVACGEIALDEARAASRRGAGVPVVLVRRDAETGDIAALDAAEGLLTQRGARTSHAAVVARQLGKVCLVGCADMAIDETARTVTFGEMRFAEGDLLTLDGNSGSVYAGRMRTVREKQAALIARLEALRAAPSEGGGAEAAREAVRGPGN